jgi:hypothetical protein
LVKHYLLALIIQREPRPFFFERILQSGSVSYDDSPPSDHKTFCRQQFNSYFLAALKKQPSKDCFAHVHLFNKGFYGSHDMIMPFSISLRDRQTADNNGIIFDE